MVGVTESLTEICSWKRLEWWSGKSRIVGENCNTAVPNLFISYNSARGCNNNPDIWMNQTPTDKSHWIYMWPTCVHRCSTCVVPMSHVYPHVMKNCHMWDTCEVGQTYVDVVCPTRDLHKLTCDYMWRSCGLLSLNITLACEMYVWNSNNT